MSNNILDNLKKRATFNAKRYKIDENNFFYHRMRDKLQESKNNISQWTTF